jgi:hypothetical protein
LLVQTCLGRFGSCAEVVIGEIGFGCGETECEALLGRTCVEPLERPMTVTKPVGESNGPWGPWLVTDTSDTSIRSVALQ